MGSQQPYRVVPLIFPRLIFLFFVLSLGLGLPLHAERKAPPPTLAAAPPQPVEMNLKVHREGKTEIPLRIYGKANEPLKYLIRTPPQHGKLSDPQAKEREVSVVVYEPPADLGVTTDKFAYAVQNGVGVSAAVEVTITIVDLPPLLQIQDTIDFSTIRAGATASRLLEISNQGGMIASGEVIVDPPWKLDGKSGYRLHNGDVAVFKVIFAPDLGGKFEGVARYTSDPEHSTTLKGVAEAAIVATPEQWVLRQIPGDTTRSGTFDLTNQLDEARTLQLKADPRLKVQAQVTIPAHASASIPIEAASENPQALETQIRLEAKDFSIGIPVQVPALSAVFRATASEVEFGRIPAGKKTTTRFELQNIGGTAGSASWEISPPFVVPEKGTTLEPGEKKDFPIEVDGKTDGKFRTWLKVHAGAQAFDIPVSAEIPSGPKAVPITSSGGGAPVAINTPFTSSSETPDSAEPSSPVQPPIPSDWVPDVTLPKGVEVNQITATRAVITWPAALSNTTKFRFEMRQLSVDRDGHLEVSWAKPTGIPIESHGSNYAAILDGLEPNQPWTVRVIALAPNGDGETRLFTVQFATPPKDSLFARLHAPSLTQLLVMALIGLLVWQIWQRLSQRRFV